jgi:hypothetical protein
VGIIQPKWELFSQIKYYSAKYYSAKYYSAKWDIIQPNVSKATFGWIIFSAKCPLRRSSGGLQQDDGHIMPIFRHPAFSPVTWVEARTYATGSHPTRLSKDLNSEPTKNQPTTVGVYMGGYFLSAKYLLFSQIFIIQPNGNYSAKYYSAKYYSAKWNIIQPNEILFSQVGILFSQTAGWLASEARCELAKSLHSEICWQAR